MKKILVIDGNSIINRAYYGVRPLSTKSGKPTNAIFGMINIISRQMDPALLAVDGLQKLVESKRIKDNLLALSIIEWAPSVGLVRLLMRLLKTFCDLKVIIL